MDSKKINKQELCNTLQKYAKDTVPNATAEEMNIYFSGLPHTAKSHTIEPGVSWVIELDDYFEFRDSKVPANGWTNITI